MRANEAFVFLQPATTGPGCGQQQQRNLSVESCRRPELWQRSADRRRQPATQRKRLVLRRRSAVSRGPGRIQSHHLAARGGVRTHHRRRGRLRDQKRGQRVSRYRRTKSFATLHSMPTRSSTRDGAHTTAPAKTTQQPAAQGGTRLPITRTISVEPWADRFAFPNSTTGMTRASSSSRGSS